MPVLGNGTETNELIEIGEPPVNCGRWNFLGPFTFRKGNRQIWLAAFYEDDFVKDDGVWKFQHFRALVRMTAPYEEGWASQAKVDVFSN